MQNTQHTCDSQRPLFLPMGNVVQNYSWGSTTSLSSLFGIPNPNQQPQAELWMSAHPNGCSTVLIGNKKIGLDDFIRSDSQAILGAAYQAFGTLPYLFKILAAESALSVQVHPNKTQAELGYAKESKMSLLAETSHNYQDTNHKPELVYALTDYHALNGFRQYNEILQLFNIVAIAELQPFVNQFESHLSSKGLEYLFAELLSLEGDERSVVINKLINYAKTKPNRAPFNLVLRLAQQYPEDIGLLAPLLLNIIILKPGEAMYLAPQTPHAYIHGTGLELMANSDNVLRAALTNKHIDLPELIACTEFTPKSIDSMILSPITEGTFSRYPLSIADFKFGLFSAPKQHSVHVDGPEIVMALDNELLLVHSSGKELQLEKGQSVFIPAYSEQYSVTSEGRVARAYY